MLYEKQVSWTVNTEGTQVDGRRCGKLDICTVIRRRRGGTAQWWGARELRQIYNC